MRMLRSLLVGTLLPLTMGLSAQAGLMTGSMPLVGFGVTQTTGSDLSNPASVVAPVDNMVKAGTGTFDFSSSIPNLTVFTGGIINLAGGPGYGFSMTNPTLRHFHCRQRLDRAPDP